MNSFNIRFRYKDCVLVCVLVLLQFTPACVVIVERAEEDEPVRLAGRSSLRAAFHARKAHLRVLDAGGASASRLSSPEPYMYVYNHTVGRCSLLYLRASTVIYVI